MNDPLPTHEASSAAVMDLDARAAGGAPPGDGGGDGVSISGLDPVLASMGEMVGLLEPGSARGELKLDDSWFSDPIGKTSAGVKENPAAFADLLGQLLGSVAGHALGVPVKDPALLGTWYPVSNPQTGDPTGLYVVTYAQTDGGVDYQVFGLGAYHAWKVPSDKPALQVDAWGLVPLLRMGNGSLEPVLQSPGYPITVGIAAEGVSTAGASAQPLVKAGQFSFNGVKFSAGLDLADAADPVKLSVVVLQLQLPGDAAPADRSLADLESISGEQILNTATSLFITALSSVSQTAADRAQYLLPALGMSTVVPGQTDALPLLRWDQLFELAFDGGDVAAPFRDWFTAVASSPQLLGLWLTSVAGFMGHAAATVTGDGSRLAPFSVPILDLTSSGVGVLSFTAATVVDPAGARSLFPGLAFAADPVALGSSTKQVTMGAMLEMAQFILSGGVRFGPPDSLRFDAGFTLADAAAGTPLASVDGYRFGSLQGGVSLGLGPVVVPSFRLVDVVTPQTSYPSLDLLSPGELATAAVTVLQAALLELLGIAGGVVPFASNVAALIGVVNPAVPAGAAWPAELNAPFSDPTRLAASLSDPLGALGRWYQASLTSDTPVDGKRAFTFVLQELAGVLNSVSGLAQVAIGGDGTPASPWTASLTAAGTDLPAALTAFEVDAGSGVTRLVLGISLAPRITLGGLEIVPSLDAQLLSLDLPQPGSSAPFGGTWGPAVSARILLPQGFTTPAVATAKLQVERASLSAGWSQDEGWAWSLFAGKPVLWIGSQKVDLGQDLDFSDLDSLRALVLDGGAAFAPLLTGVTGVALLSSGTRAGLAATGVLGLLGDLQQAPGWPAGLAWPATMPRLALPGLTDPRPALRAQVAAVLGSADTAVPALSLLGYALNPDSATAPAVSGDGTAASPWAVPLMGTGFQALVSFDAGSSALCVGAGRADTFTYGTALKVDVATRLDAAGWSMTTGAATGTPSLGFTATLASPAGGALVQLPGGIALDAAVLGMRLTLDGGAVRLDPVVTLVNAVLPGRPAGDVTLADFQDPAFTGELQQAFLSLVNGAVQAAVGSAAGGSGFRTAYSLLAAMGLTLRRTADGDPYGISPAGWQALLASPTRFVAQQVTALLVDPDLRATLFAFIESTLHLELPRVPVEVLAVMEGLGIVGPPEQGYPLRPDALLALAQHPFATLSDRFEQLANDAALRASVVTQLTANVPSTSFGPFTFQVVNGTHLVVGVDPAKALGLGGVLTLGGQVSLDLAQLRLGAGVRLYAPPLGLALVPALAVQAAPGSVTSAFAADLVWGDGTRPAAEPLRVFPFDSTAFLQQLADVAPAYVLNVVVNQVMQSQLLEKYPLVQQVFSGLGLARQEDGTWTMPALLGLLRDPRGWLLSEGILGEDGQFSIASFGALLRHLPAVAAPNGVGVAPTATGAQVTGLPYGFSLQLGSTATQATFGFATTNLAVGGGAAVLQELGVTLTLGSDYQPGIAGSLTLATAAGAAQPFWVEAGYDHAFQLVVGQGTPGAPAGISLQLLPFLGWGTLLEQAGRAVAPALLKDLVPRLLTALQADPGTAGFATRLQTVGTALDVAALVDSLAAVTPFTLANLEQAALDWLLARFDPANAPNTARAVAAVFSDVIPGQVTTQGGLVAYAPGKSLPLTLFAGMDDSGGTPLLGVWAELSLPEISVLRASVRRTGIGVPLSGPVQPVFSFGVVLTVPVDGTVGPQLGLTYEPGTGLVLAVDPLGDAAAVGTASSLRRELLPQFFPAGAEDPPELEDRVTAWLLAVVKDVLPRYVSSVMLNLPQVQAWLQAPIVGGKDGPRPIFVLTATSLVVAEQVDGAPRYYLNTLQALSQLTPEVFLGNLIQALLKTPLTLLTWGKDGASSITVGPGPDGEQSYGVRLVAPDLAIPGVPNLVLQLGGTDSDWIAKAGGSTDKLEPGISLYVPVTGTGLNIAPRFGELELNLVNVGVDFVGKEGQPLVDLTRFRLGSVKPRVLVTLELNDGTPDVSFGGEVTLGGIQISLAPNTLAPGGGNPIAQNLLGSGTSGSDANPPTNPKFSVSAGYAGSLYVNLVSDSGEGQQVIIPVQRTFGPLYVGSLGIGWEQEPKLLDFLFTGSVALAGLRADLTGLTVSVPVTDPLNWSAYKLDLQGLGVSFQGGAVSISGGLLKTTVPYLSYTGAALITGSKFSIVAMGSYALAPVDPSKPDGEKAPSLFIFGALRAPLGGVPAFFVTGVAAGFGFNRSLAIPAVGDVQNFPLVQGVVDGSFGGDEGPGAALARLGTSVQPAVGQYWVAAGLTFTSFTLLQGAALVFLSFGREWAVDLVGIASASLPPQVPRNQALVYVELAFKVSIQPTRGVISAEAQLTPNSFVLARDCKLTGGFAFYLWFLDVVTDEYTIPAGDFVLTLGGYHPAFQPPKYYPTVPRLGFSWIIDAGVGRVAIGGGAYFALLPTAAMAGGYLRVTFDAGPLRAWLDAYANFLIEWQPFYYSVSIGVNVGVAFQTTVLGVTITLKVSLGAELLLEGPPTHGYARVSWYVISFTIPFGDDKTATSQSNLTWAQFSAAFLPPPAAPDTGGGATPAMRAMAATRGLAAAAAPADGAVQQVVKLGAQDGLLSEPGPDGLWRVRPVPFTLRVDTSIPVNTASVPESGFTLAGAAVGVRPLGLTSTLDAPLTVEVLDGTGKAVDLVGRGVTLGAALNGAPAALWSKQPLDRNQVPDGKTMILPGALMGLVLDASQYVIYGDVPPFAIGALEYTTGTPVPLPLAHPPAWGPAPRYPDADQAQAFAILGSSIMDPGVAAARNAVFAALRAGGLAAPADPDLSVMASSAALVMQSPPVLARVGIYQAGSVAPNPVRDAAPAAVAASVALPPPLPERTAAVVPPRLVGIRRRHAAGGAAPPPVLRAAAFSAAGADFAPGAEAAPGGTVERWTDLRATRADRRLRVPGAPLMAADAGPGAADEASGASLHAGTLALWQVDPAASTRLSARGGLPLRLTAFDADGELLADVDAGAGLTTTLPDGTGHVAVQGVAPADGGAAGWTLASRVTKVVHGFAIADGCSVRAQNLNRVRQGRTPVRTGTLSMDQVLRQNVVQHLGGALVPGWVETVFTRPAERFTVLVRARGEGDAAERVRVSARRSASPGAERGEPLAPEARVERDGLVLLAYRVPGAEPGAAYLNVLVQPLDDGVVLQGVSSVEAPEHAPFMAAGAAEGLDPEPALPRLQVAALDPARAAPDAAAVTVTSTPNHAPPR